MVAVRWPLTLSRGAALGTGSSSARGGPLGGVGLAVAGDELHAQPAEDVVGDALGDRDVRVLGEPGRLEPAMRELVDEDLQRHAVLQADRDRRPQDVHQAADRRALLGHRDEELAGPAVGIEADVDIPLVALDVELVGQAAAGMRQPLAAGLNGVSQERARRARPSRFTGGTEGHGRRDEGRSRGRAGTASAVLAESVRLGLGAHGLAPLGAVAVNRQGLEPELPAFEVGAADLATVASFGTLHVLEIAPDRNGCTAAIIRRWPRKWMLRPPCGGANAQSKTGRCSSFSPGAPSIVSCVVDVVEDAADHRLVIAELAQAPWARCG